MAERNSRWTRTWADVPEDYIAFDESVKIGRVHRMNSISSGEWYWVMNARREWSGSCAGTVETRHEACHEVERQYDAMVARIAAAKAPRWKPGQPVRGCVQHG